ncbi:MAG TPA: hypothetical protein DEA32_00065, partial [Firmicutes bacterium]|nr:hypothetical protein [Bacillota bacterium]
MGKLKYIIERLLLAIVTGFIILTLTFILVKLLPEQVPAGQVSQQLSYYQKQVSLGYYLSSPTAVVEGFGEPNFIYTPSSGGAAIYFFKLPIMSQYGAWLKNVFTKWDWGTSSTIEVNRDVFVLIGQRLGPTVVVNAITIVFAVPC